MKKIFEYVGYLATLLGLTVSIITLFNYYQSHKKIYEFDVDSVAHSNLNGWYDTKINLSLNKTYTITATNNIQLAPSHYANANGNATRYNCGAFACGTLIGRLGSTGETFSIGRNSTLTNKKGRLYLAVWDSNHQDNNGSFHVTIIKGN